MKKILAVLAAVPMLAACGPDTSGITSLTGVASSGQSLFAANCSSCHGAGTQLASIAKSSPDEVASTVLSGDGRMPSFSSSLSNQQIADIIAFLATK